MSLLDDLAGLANCLYLSELRRPEIRIRLGELISRLEEKEYSLKEWEDAVHYLTTCSIRFETVSQARHFFLSSLGGLDAGVLAEEQTKNIL